MFQLTRRSRTIDIWPGFVDALASVLIVFIFMLLVFVLAQFYATWELAGREATISRLERSIEELARTLSLERDRSTGLESQLSDLESRRRATLAERDALFGRLPAAEGQLNLTQAELEEAKLTVRAARETIEARLADMEEVIRETVAETAAARRLGARVRPVWRRTPTPMDDRLAVALAEAAEGEAPGRWRRMTSGALHDAMNLARLMPAAMLFVPSIGGISHAFDEDTGEDDLLTGLRVLARAVATS